MSMTPKEMAEVILAFDRGSKIEQRVVSEGAWRAVSRPRWNFGDSDYRIAKPEPKKVKLYAFINKDNGYLFFSGLEKPSIHFYRAPQLDVEVE